jgi:hypothetical protein
MTVAYLITLCNRNYSGDKLTCTKRPNEVSAMSQASIARISPFFIVRNVSEAISFYCQMLGFGIVFQEPEREPFLAIVQRDGAMIFLKDVGVESLPNCKRHPWARWDAYASVPDPDALAAEFTSRGVTFLNLYKTPTMVYGALNLKTLTATSCFSAVLVDTDPVCSRKAQPLRPGSGRTTGAWGAA